MNKMFKKVAAAAAAAMMAVSMMAVSVGAVTNYSRNNPTNATLGTYDGSITVNSYSTYKNVISSIIMTQNTTPAMIAAGIGVRTTTGQYLLVPQEKRNYYAPYMTYSEQIGTTATIVATGYFTVSDGTNSWYAECSVTG